jgi:hypothetical protein
MSTSVGSEFVISGVIQSPLSLVRRLPDKWARVSFRIDSETGPVNAHADGATAEYLRAALRKGDTLTARCHSIAPSADRQSVPDVIVESLEPLAQVA